MGKNLVRKFLETEAIAATGSLILGGVFTGAYCLGHNFVESYYELQGASTGLEVPIKKGLEMGAYLSAGFFSAFNLNLLIKGNKKS